jgi:hypothetical protein
MIKFFKGKIENPITPFSNGTEAMMWMDENCDHCTKAFHVDEEKGWPKESTLKEYVRCGKYCKFQYWIDISFIEAAIPKEIAEGMGYTEEKRFPRNCLHYSDNEDDGYKPPKRPKPDNTPDNQLLMPFFLQEIGIKEVEKELCH